MMQSATTHAHPGAWDFTGKRVLVTGGTAGLGQAIVRNFLEAGASVATTARGARPEGQPSLLYIQADVSTAGGAASVVSRVQEEFGGLDILINSVGGSSATPGGFAAMTDELWEHELSLNLMPAVRLDRAFLPHMIAQGAGVIVHVSSIQRSLPLYQSTLGYAAAKAALTTYSKGLSKEVGPKGVRVVTVSPGGIETTAAQRMISNLATDAGTDTDAARATLFAALGGVPIGRFAQPQEVADLITFVASARAGAIHGTEFVIDGGTIPTI